MLNESTVVTVAERGSLKSEANCPICALTFSPQILAES